MTPWLRLTNQQLLLIIAAFAFLALIVNLLRLSGSDALADKQGAMQQELQAVITDIHSLETELAGLRTALRDKVSALEPTIQDLQLSLSALKTAVADGLGEDNTHNTSLPEKEQQPETPQDRREDVQGPNEPETVPESSN